MSESTKGTQPERNWGGERRLEGVGWLSVGRGTTSPPRQTCKKQRIQKRLRKTTVQQLGEFWGYRGRAELAADNNDCNNSTKYDHGSGMCAFSFVLSALFSFFSFLDSEHVYVCERRGCFVMCSEELVFLPFRPFTLFFVNIHHLDRLDSVHCGAGWANVRSLSLLHCLSVPCRLFQQNICTRNNAHSSNSQTWEFVLRDCPLQRGPAQW